MVFSYPMDLMAYGSYDGLPIPDGSLLWPYHLPVACSPVFSSCSSVLLFWFVPLFVRHGRAGGETQGGARVVIVQCILGGNIDTIGHAQGIGNKMIVLYTPCPFLWFLINFLRRKIVLLLFSDRCSDFSSSCCSL